MEDKFWLAKIVNDSNDTIHNKARPKLTIEAQVTYMRDVKGIKFNIVSEQQAAAFLSENNYYFKLKAFCKNYSKFTFFINSDNALKFSSSHMVGFL